VPGRLHHATVGRLFAAAYDRFLARSEELGLREQRHALLAQARGATLELGAGTGLNLAHYPPAVEELVLSEPSAFMAKRLRRRVADAARAAEIVVSHAERLPFPDARFDTVSATLVLCSVHSQSAVLAEVARVLRPGGRFLFLEHVRAGEEEPRLACWQDRLAPAWRYVADGCVCNLPTLARIEASPLELDAVERTTLPGAAPIVRPAIVGRALKPAGA
jgi:ubiquinone/menaquinone biosynthesis C-methylase UbiE